MSHRRAIVSLLPLAGMVLAVGCEPAPVPSQLVGQWQGRVVTSTTRAAPTEFEDFALTILPGGRFAMVGMIDGSRIDRPGQVVDSVFGPGLRARVLQVHYATDASSVSLEFNRTADDDTPTRAGMTQSARLTADGRLEYRSFYYGMAIGDPGRSEGISQIGLLQRVSSNAPQTVD